VSKQNIILLIFILKVGVLSWYYQKLITWNYHAVREKLGQDDGPPVSLYSTSGGTGISPVIELGIRIDCFP